MSDHHSTRDSSFGDDRSPIPDAQGQAALLLIESLIHSLLDNGALTKEQAIQALDSAYEVKEESAADRKEASATLLKSLGLLQSMRISIGAHSGPYHSAPYDEHPGGPA